MPLKVDFGNNIYVTPASFSRGYDAWTSAAAPFPVWDAIQDLARGALMAFPPDTCDHLAGYTARDDMHTLTDLGYRRSDEYSGSDDYWRYGSTLACLQNLVHGGHFLIENENQIYHASSVGHVVTGKSVPLYENVHTEEYQTLRYPHYSYFCPQWFRYDADLKSYSIRDVWDGTNYWTFPHSPFVLWDDKLFGIVQRGGTIEFHSLYYGNDFIGRCKNVQWNVSGNLLSVSYDSSYSAVGPVEVFGQHDDGCFIRWHTSWTISLNYNMFGLSKPSTGIVDFRPWALVTPHEVVTYEVTAVGMKDWTFINSGGLVSSKQVGSRLTTSNNLLFNFASFPLVSLDVERTTGRAFSIYAGPRRVIEDSFRNWCSANMSDIRPASALSTAAAMTDLESSANTDVLQTLVKITDLSSQLPELSKTVSDLRRLLRKDLSSIPEIISDVTQLRLQQGFQWRPELDLILKYLPQIPGIFSSLNQKHPYVYGRGRYDYQFLSSECPRDTKLTVRSKIVARSNLSSELASYLRLDALGILPTAPNLWDIMPFSFVVNWFTNMGQRIRTVGQLANLWFLDVVTLVHSYTLTSVLTDSEMDECNLSSLSGPNPCMRVYIREISRYIPLGSISRFDFERPTRAPDWSIVASLLWQWMR